MFKEDSTPFDYDGNGYGNRQDVLDAIEKRRKWLQELSKQGNKGKVAPAPKKRLKRA